MKKPAPVNKAHSTTLDAQLLIDPISTKNKKSERPRPKIIILVMTITNTTRLTTRITFLNIIRYLLLVFYKCILFATMLVVELEKVLAQKLRMCSNKVVQIARHEEQHGLDQVMDVNRSLQNLKQRDHVAKHTLTEHAQYCNILTICKLLWGQMCMDWTLARCKNLRVHTDKSRISR
jgi:hypothetical protein